MPSSGRFFTRPGDLSKPFRVTVRRRDGTPFSFVDWTTPTFVMVDSSSTTPVLDYVPATIVNAAGGVLEYAWQAGDTDAPGTYRVAFRVLDPSGNPRHFPDDDQLLVSIEGLV